GVTRAGGAPFAADPRVRATLFIPAGARGPAFLLTDNFRALMKYNPAEAYALGAGHLADRLRGGRPLVGAWPREERGLTRAARLGICYGPAMTSGFAPRIGVLLLGLAEAAAAAIALLALLSPASAQIDDRFPFMEERRRRYQQNYQQQYSPFGFEQSRQQSGD